MSSSLRRHHEEENDEEGDFELSLLANAATRPSRQDGEEETMETGQEGKERHASPRRGEGSRRHLSSAPPGAGASAARGHRRSASHGAALLLRREDFVGALGRQEAVDEAEEEEEAEQRGGGGVSATEERQEERTRKPLQSVLKKTSAARGHRRVFSHGQIPLQMTEEGDPGAGSNARRGGLASGRGHRRTGSKTDFILPPGHEERERRR